MKVIVTACDIFMRSFSHDSTAGLSSTSSNAVLPQWLEKSNRNIDVTINPSQYRISMAALFIEAVQCVCLVTYHEVHVCFPCCSTLDTIYICDSDSNIIPVAEKHVYKRGTWSNLGTSRSLQLSRSSLHKFKTTQPNRAEEGHPFLISVCFLFYICHLFREDLQSPA